MTTVEKLTNWLKGEVGYHEGRSGGHWNNKEKYAAMVPGLEWANFQAWCATFASAAYLKAGLTPNVDFPVTASVAAAKAWYQAHGRYSEYPAIGAQAIYSPSHTGIVIGYDADTITAIEGNTNTNGSREGDGVYRKVRLRRAANVVGYGYPKFPEGVVSADPAWARKAVKPPVKPAPAKAAPKAGPAVVAAVKAIQKIKPGPVRNRAKAAALAALKKIGG